MPALHLNQPLNLLFIPTMAVVLLTTPTLTSQLLHGLIFIALLFSIIYLYTHIHNNNSNNSNKPKVVEAAVLETFPIFNYGEFRHNKSYDAGELQCAICREEYADDDVVRILPHCCHVFKRECIDEWLLRYSVECPVCRADVSRPPAAGAGRPASGRVYWRWGSTGAEGGERVDPHTLRLPASAWEQLLARRRRVKSLSGACVDGEDGRQRYWRRVGVVEKWGMFLRSVSVLSEGRGVGGDDIELKPLVESPGRAP